MQASIYGLLNFPETDLKLQLRTSMNLKQIRSTLDRFFFFRDDYQDQQRYIPIDQKFIIFLGIILFFITVLWRSWDNFINPGLHMEDTTHYFNLFYGGTGSIKNIFHQYNGYYVLLTKFTTYLISKADITWQPYLYQFFGLSVCTLTIIAFSFSGLVTNRIFLLFGPALLGLSGFNHLYYYITVCYQVYVFPILIFLLLLSRKRPSRFSKFFLPVALLMLICSTPYSVLVVPFCLIYIVLFRDRIPLCLFLILATLAYTFTVEKGTALLGQMFYLEILAHWGIALVTHVFFMGFTETVNSEKLLLIAAVFLSTLILLYKDRQYLKTAILILVLIVTSLAPFFLSIKFLLYRTAAPSHVVIAQFFWLVLILITFDRLLTRFTISSRLGNAFFALPIILFIFADNIRTPDKGRAEIFIDTPKFTQTIKSYEAEAPQLAEQGKKIVITTDREGIFNPVAIVGDPSGKATLVKKIIVKR